MENRGPTLFCTKPPQSRALAQPEPYIPMPASGPYPGFQVKGETAQRRLRRP